MCDRLWLSLVLLMVCVACGGSSGAEPAIVHSDQITGGYGIVGTNPPPFATAYVGEVSVVSDATGEIEVVWVIGTDQWDGVGTITDDGDLYVVYEGVFPGNGTWVLQPDGSLQGIWQAEGDSATGTENWYPLPSGLPANDPERIAFLEAGGEIYREAGYGDTTSEALLELADGSCVVGFSGSDVAFESFIDGMRSHEASDAFKGATIDIARLARSTFCDA